MRRTLRSRVLLTFAASGLALAPLSLAAQGAQQTHTVRKGDTLWDLAQQYLGDPFRWPEIYRRNTATVKDPHWIYPDQVLIISGDVAATPGTPADTAVAPPPVVPGDTAAAREPVAQPEEQQPVYVQRPMTIFNPARFKVVRGSRASLVLRARASAVRAGDYLRAPYMVGSEGLPGSGEVGATTSADAVNIKLSRRPIQLYERIYVTLPAGSTGAKDERYLLFRYGPNVGDGRVIVPTGIIKLNGPATDGRAEAVLLSKYEDVYSEQGVTLMDSLTIRPGVFPTRVEFGVKTTLVWVYDEPVLPSIGHHILFAAGAAEGLVPGDQITLQRDLGTDSRGVPLPPEDIAVAQVTRVTQWGTSAMLIGHTDGSLKPGLAARVTAKMP